jgi:glycosyltransferase involved in cell wall biosynthesis
VVKVIRKLYKNIFKRYDAVYIQNESDYREFLSHGFKFKNHKVIPGSGVDIERFTSSRGDFRDSGDAKFIFIARLLRNKGFFEFVESAERIKKDFPHIEFYVLGSIYTKGERGGEVNLSLITELENKGLITYLGTTLNVIPIIEQMDCVVLPSYREGLSNSLMEAAALERPIITTDVPGCKELVDDEISGLICKVRSTEDLELKLRRFISFSANKRKNMGANGRLKMIDSFSRKNVILEYTRFISQFV